MYLYNTLLTLQTHHILLYILQLLFTTTNLLQQLYIYNIDCINKNDSLLNVLLNIHPTIITLLIFSQKYLISVLIYKYNIVYSKKINNKLILFYFYKYVKAIIYILTLTILLGSGWSLQELTWNSWWNWDNIEKNMLLNLSFKLLLLHLIIYKFLFICEFFYKYFIIILLLILLYDIVLFFDINDSPHIFIILTESFLFYFTLFFWIIFTIKNIFKISINIIKINFIIYFYFLHTQLIMYYTFIAILYFLLTSLILKSNIYKTLLFNFFLMKNLTFYPNKNFKTFYSFIFHILWFLLLYFFILFINLKYENLIKNNILKLSNYNTILTYFAKHYTSINILNNNNHYFNNIYDKTYMFNHLEEYSIHNYLNLIKNNIIYNIYFFIKSKKIYLSFFKLNFNLTDNLFLFTL